VCELSQQMSLRPASVATEDSALFLVGSTKYNNTDKKI